MCCSFVARQLADAKPVLNHRYIEAAPYFTVLYIPSFTRNVVSFSLVHQSEQQLNSQLHEISW